MTVPYTFANASQSIPLAELDANFAYLDAKGTTYYPAINAETAVSATITNYFYPPGNVLRYGADPTYGSDSTSAFQTAVNVAGCQSAGSVSPTNAPTYAAYVPMGSYKFSNTVYLKNSYTALIGDPDMPVITQTASNIPAFCITSQGSGYINEWSVIRNFRIYEGATPSYNTPSATNCGIAISGNFYSTPTVQRAEVSRVRLLGWGCGMYLSDSVNTKLERIYVENYTTWGAPGSGAKQYIGFYFDGTPYSTGSISPQASIECWNLSFNGTGAPSGVTATGFYMSGADIRDIFMTDCETSGGAYGYYIQSTNHDFDWDININRPITDSFTNSGIYITGVSGPGSVTINGGYVAPASAATGACVWVNSSTGVQITGGFQIIGVSSDSTGNEGIRVLNSSNCSILGVDVLNCGYGISLDGSSFCTVTSNYVHTAVSSSGATPVLYEGIRLFDSSSNNTICANTIQGVSSSNKYNYGITVTSGCVSNMVVGNALDTTTINTIYNIADSSTIVVGSKQIQFNGSSAGTSAITFNTMATTGSTTASFSSSNKPGSNNQTSPAKWLPVTFDGTVYYIPAFGA